MAEPTQTDKDAAYAEWEAKWEKQDFSWEGLKKHEWRAPADFPGSGEVRGEGESAYKLSNLQEYWRWNLGQFQETYADNALLHEDFMEKHTGLLKRRDGKLWHVVHLKTTDASKHTALKAALFARLKAAAAPSENPAFFFSDTPDPRCQLAGARAIRLDQLLRQFGKSQDAPEGQETVLNVNAAFTEFASGDFSTCIFGDYASFNGTQFTDDADFRSARFLKTISFEEAKWGWDEETKTYLPVHYGRTFYNARFHEAANFETDRFTAFAAFDGAEFDRKLYLRLPNKSKEPKQHFDHASKAVLAEIAKDEEAARKSEDDNRPPDLVSTSAKTKYWGELAAGYKTAKAAMHAGRGRF